VVQAREFHDPYDATPRQVCPVLPLERRMGFTEVELPYSAEQAAVEGNRCLRCNYNIFLDGQRCILCGGCVDVCPYQCIAMVSASRVDWNAAAGDFPAGAGRGQGYAMVLDETRCIRCGLCVRRCPTDAITMRSYQARGEWVYG
jgi:formate dehydrogenase beta subunit